MNPTYNATQAVVICQGSTYTFPDGTTGSTELLHTSVLATAAGCDSIIVTNLTLTTSFNTTEDVAICQGATHTFPDGTTGTTAQSYTCTLTSMGGCDSLVVTNLAVNPTYNATENISICDGSTYTFPDGTTGIATQSYTSLLTSATGCDSTIVTNLTVNPAYNNVENVAICDGATFTFPDGTTGTTSQSYTSSLTTVTGCDSIIVTHLTVNPAYNNVEDITICKGDTYTFPDGTTGNSTQSYTSSLTSVTGCDSIIVTNLTVDAIDNTVTATATTLTANQAGAVYQWIDCGASNSPLSGAVDQSYTATAVTGNYAVIITVANCVDTSDCALVDLTTTEEHETGVISIYPNPP